MIATNVLDPVLSSRLCLTLVHSLWQVALLTAIAWCGDRLLRSSVERRYLLHVAAMITGLMLLPVTFAMLDVATPLPGHAVLQSDNEAHPTIAQAQSQPLSADPAVEEFTSVRAVPPELAGPPRSAPPRAVAAAVSPTGATAWIQLAPWLAIVYVAGVGLMLLRLCFGVWSAQRLVASSRPARDSALLVRLDHLARRLAIRALPAIAYSEEVVVPRIVGLLRPVILLPSSMMTGLAPEQVEMVLAHELTHLRRHDMWVNLLQRLVEIVLFFNPPMWYLSHRINVLREYSCDDAVCRLASNESEDARYSYAAALLQIAELSQTKTAAGRSGRSLQAGQLTTLAAAGRSPSELRRRIARLVGEPIREPLHLSRGGLLLVCVVALAVVFSSSLWPVAAQTDVEDASAEEREATAEPAEPQQAPDDGVEVIAIGSHNQQPQRWWDASGTIIETPPFEWTAGHDVSDDDRQWSRVVLRVRDLAATDEVRWEIAGEPDSWGATVTIDGKKNPRGYYSRQFVVPEGQRTLRLRVGIASGEWKTVAAFGTHNTIEVKRGEPSFISAGTFEVDGGTTVMLTHDTFEHNFRVVAVDKQGQSHDSGDRGGLSTNTKIYQSRATFSGLSREQIDHFEFQTRPYEWTEIENLPLEPRAVARKSAAAADGIEVLDSAAVRLEDGTTIRLIAVSNNRDHSGDKEWWKPDGKRLRDAPYSRPGMYSNEQTAYEFAFEISGNNDVGFAGGQGFSVGTPSRDDHRRPDMRAVVSSQISAGARKADVLIAVASGEWDTVESWKGYRWEAGAGSSVIRNEKGVMLTWPRELDDAVQVTLAHKYVKEQTRLVALLDGQLVEGKQRILGEGDGIEGMVWTFTDVTLDDQFELAFQRRPYTWIKILDVSVDPEYRTNPRVEVSDNSVSQTRDEQREFPSIVQPEADAESTAEVSQDLDDVLRDWEEKTAVITSLYGTHKRYEYDEIFGIETRAVGEFWYGPPDKGRIDFNPAPLENPETGTSLVSGKQDASGQRYRIETDDPLSWVCDGESIVQVEHDSKTYGLYEISPQRQGDVMDSLLPKLFGMNPFGIDADKLKQRYRLSLGSQHNQKIADGRRKYHIIAKPKLASDALNWQRVEVILDARYCLPTAIRMIDPAGAKETVYVFALDSMRANKGHTDPDPFKMNLWGYKLHEKPADTRPDDATDGLNPERGGEATGVAN